MDVNAAVDNINEYEANSEQNVENLGAVKDEEVRAVDVQLAVTVDDVVIVEEDATPTAVKDLVVNDNVVFQVAENTQEIRQFVATECTTDGVVTFVTVAPSSTQETVSTGYVEQMPCGKEQVEILQETYENITQGNMIVEENNMFEQESSVMIQEDNVMVQGDCVMVQEDNIMVPEDNIIVQENDMIIQENNAMVQENNVMIQEDNVIVQEDNVIVQEDNVIDQEDTVMVQEDNYELPRQSYEKFVQDAIKGEIEEPIILIPETTETEIIKQEKIHEISENVQDDQGVNKRADSIEAKLQELTEGHAELHHLEVTKEECKDASIKMNDVADTGNESSVDDQIALDHSNINEAEEIITADFVGVEDQIEQSTSEEPEASIPDAIVIDKPGSPQDNIEKQLSKIVHDEEPHQLSIAEEISRDFDDSDSDELTVSQQEPHDDVIEEVVNIAKQLGRGPVTVTDTTGQVYYVESVEEVIVVENDPKIIERKEVQEEVVEEERPAPPPIPSHLLGRNIDNPIEDTFRNGKTPPKPRLGVKIPYKHLTSQIVSKEDITKELLERSKSKVLQSRTSREQYFTNKLTRRLAKKIAPNTHQKHDKGLRKDKEINNSDLIAILEGKDEDKHVEGKTQSDEKIVHMDKELERELALKQLSELPRRGRRRKSSGYDIIENVNIPPRVRRSDIKSDSKEEGPIQKTNQPKVIVEQSNRNVVVESASMEHCSMEEQQQTEVDETHMEARKLSTEIKKTYADIKKPHVEVKTTCAEVPKQNEKSNIQMEKSNIEPEKLNHDSAKPNIGMKESNMERRKLIVEVKSPIGEQKKSKMDSPTLKDGEPKVVVETSKITVQKIEELSKADQKESPEISSEEVDKKPINLPIKTYERKRKSTDESITPIPEKKPVIKSSPSNVYVTKSSRVIKKKIIWDPDDPTTAKYAADKISPQRIIKGTPLVKVIVKETRKTELPSTQIKPIGKPEQPDKIISKLEKVVSKSKPDSGDKDTKSKSPETTSRTKKRLSEVDKLLMDEGAVNLLYSVKNEDTKRFTGSTISLDKIQKELMNKTNEIKRELTSSTDKISPKSLRKKDSPAATPTKKSYPASISRKKSKDSNRSSIHSPPASPSPMIYANHADASRIIRRHSSSSYSSTEGDELNEEHKDEKKPPKKRLKQEVGQSSADKRKINEENFSKWDEENKSNNYNFDYSKFEQYTAIKVGQLDNLVQVSLLCEESEKAYLTYEVLLELIDLLKELQTDDLCKVVVLSSTAPSFCHGINYKSLHIEDEQIRKEIAQKLAKAVTEYLKTLANFPKIIIAGVQGDCIGLAVTMLPLFDMVLASDTASFSIPNAKLGCAAEGGSLLSLPHLMHNALVSEMLYASRKFVAAEALRFGMVTRVIWPDKFQTELVAAVKEISTHSLQFKQITKRQLRNRMKHQIEESLAGEEEVLLETWISAECQKNFETYD